MRNMSLVACKNNAILKLFEAGLVDQYGMEDKPKIVRLVMLTSCCNKACGSFS